jgi:ATP-dependent DNA helicase RecG
MKSFAEISGTPLSVLQSVNRPLRLPAGKREPRRRADALEQMGVLSVLDLLTHYPRRYLDRTSQVPISELKEGDDATVIAFIRKVQRRPARRGAKPIVVVDVWDQRSYLSLSFFNQPWRANYLREGMEVAISGKVTTFRGRRQMSNPSVEVVEGEWMGRVVPIYPQSEKAGITKR